MAALGACDGGRQRLFDERTKWHAGERLVDAAASATPKSYLRCSLNTIYPFFPLALGAMRMGSAFELGMFSWMTGAKH